MATKALPLNPNYLSTRVDLAVLYSELYREEERRTEAAEVLRISPNFSLEALRQMLPSTEPQTERMIAALRKAGLK